jgi:hypothetical protein
MRPSAGSDEGFDGHTRAAVGKGLVAMPEMGAVFH